MWIVDTCVAVDILKDHDRFGEASMQLYDQYFDQGLGISPTVYAELAPLFPNEKIQHQVLEAFGLEILSWEKVDTIKSSEGWRSYIHLKRQQNTEKRVIADIMIGAFASRFQGLITRNPKDFEPYFPDLKILNPMG